MKKIICIIAVLLLLPCVPIPSYAYSASAYILYEPSTGTVLASSNEHEELPMASTTKIMTALVLLDSGGLEEIVTVTKEMVMVEGTSIGLQVGDRIPKLNLLYGMMLESGNDAANAIAVAVGGNSSVFADKMNQKAAKIGMQNSHFVTPSGLDAETHHTTAYDMALLASAAMQNETFRNVVSTQTYKSVYNDGNTTRTYSNHNRLLKQLDGCDGIKTGFTSKAGRCLVSSCVRDGVRLIAVTLHAPNDWEDHTELYEYGFSQMVDATLSADTIPTTIPIAGGRLKKVRLQADETTLRIPQSVAGKISSIAELPSFLYAPANMGDEVGKISYYIGDKKLAESPVYLAESVKKKKVKKINGLTQWLNWFIMLLSLK